LLTESEIFKDEILSGTECTDSPAHEMAERRDDGQNHGQNLIGTRRIQVASKSFILRLLEVLTRDTLVFTQGFIVAAKSLIRNGNSLERSGVEPPELGTQIVLLVLVSV
jgi:hypothetical protein